MVKTKKELIEDFNNTDFKLGSCNYTYVGLRGYCLSINADVFVDNLEELINKRKEIQNAPD